MLPWKKKEPPRNGEVSFKSLGWQDRGPVNSYFCTEEGPFQGKHIHECCGRCKTRLHVAIRLKDKKRLTVCPKCLIECTSPTDPEEEWIRKRLGNQ